MARTKATKVESNFSLGLNTETTLLKYPPNSCTETLDCIFDSIGNVTRRKGYDIETSGVTNLTAYVASEVYNEFIWTSVGGDGDRSFLVTQKGAILSFFDISSTSITVTPNRKTFSYDINNAKPSGSTFNPALELCSFANGRGKLIVTNSATDPIYIEYESTTDTFTVTKIDVLFRDFEGLQSEHSSVVNTRLNVSSLATAIASHPKHIYNLYNQGWTHTDALTQWDTARTDLPSNADSVGLYRLSETDAFDPARVGPTSPGSTEAPKGRFILKIGEENRQAVSGLLVDSASSVSTGFASPPITYVPLTQLVSPQTAGAHTLVSLSNADNSNTTDFCLSARTINLNNSTSSISVGGLFVKNVAGQRISSVSIRAPASQTFASASSGIVSVALQLRAKTGAAPTAFSEGVALSSSIIVPNVAGSVVSLVSTDVSTLWDHVWVQVFILVQTPSGSTNTVSIRMGSIEFFSVAQNALSFRRPEVTAFFAGRSWYAANSYSDKGTNIYFSQVIERNDQFGKCYQRNDPTSEQFFDLLPSDGGVVSIPEIANVQSLFPIRSALVVLATNGTWVIRGSSSEGFSATSYRVEKVSSIGCVSRASVTDVKGLPYWAGEDGFYTIEYDPNYNAFQQKSLSDERIRSFYQEIPANNRRFIKGTFDTTEQIVRFIYNDIPELVSDDSYVYNKQLNFDFFNKTWYPWTFPNGNIKVRGIVSVVDSNHIYEARVKYVVTMVSGANIFWTLGEQINGTTWQDWTTLATVNLGAPSEVRDYTSFFVTAPMIEGETQRFGQANYIYIFQDALTNASCRVTPRFDWTNSGTSGKWGTTQETYPTTVTNRDVSQRRLKLRGKGRSLQLKFASSSGKPFSILGWSIFETTNAGV